MSLQNEFRSLDTSSLRTATGQYGSGTTKPRIVKYSSEVEGEFKENLKQDFLQRIFGNTRTKINTKVNSILNLDMHNEDFIKSNLKNKQTKFREFLENTGYITPHKRVNELVEQSTLKSPKNKTEPFNVPEESISHNENSPNGSKRKKKSPGKSKRRSPIRIPPPSRLLAANAENTQRIQFGISKRLKQTSMDYNINNTPLNKVLTESISLPKIVTKYNSPAQHQTIEHLENSKVLSHYKEEPYLAKGFDDELIVKNSTLNSIEKKNYAKSKSVAPQLAKPDTVQDYGSDYLPSVFKVKKSSSAVSIPQIHNELDLTLQSKPLQITRRQNQPIMIKKQAQAELENHSPYQMEGMKNEKLPKIAKTHRERAISNPVLGKTHKRSTLFELTTGELATISEDPQALNSNNNYLSVLKLTKDSSSKFLL